MAASTTFVAGTVLSLGPHGLVSQRYRGDGSWLAGAKADCHPLLPSPGGAGTESVCFQKTLSELGRESLGAGAMGGRRRVVESWRKVPLTLQSKPPRIRVSLTLSPKGQLVQPTIFHKKTLPENQGYSQLLRLYLMNLSSAFPFGLSGKPISEERGQLTPGQWSFLSQNRTSTCSTSSSKMKPNYCLTCWDQGFFTLALLTFRVWSLFFFCRGGCPVHCTVLFTQV